MAVFFWNDEQECYKEDKSVGAKIDKIASKNEKNPCIEEAKERQRNRNMNMKIRFKRMHKDAKAPFKKNINDAGWDLTVASVSVENGLIVYDSGIAVEIPNGYVGLLFPRSSIANTDLILSNSVGVIDSCYRGSVMAKFIVPKHDAVRNSKGDMYDVGDRFCQLIIMPYPSIEWEESDELTDTIRGDGGYGSTGGINNLK